MKISKGYIAGSLLLIASCLGFIAKALKPEIPTTEAQLFQMFALGLGIIGIRHKQEKQSKDNELL